MHGLATLTRINRVIAEAQIRTKTATSQTKHMTSTPAKPTVPQTKAPAQATLQAPAQAPVGPPAFRISRRGSTLRHSGE